MAKKLDTKKCLIATGVSFVIIFAFDWLLHGCLLKSTYESTQALWRKPEECIFPVMLLGQILLAGVVSCIFTKGYEGKGIAEGVRFGVLIGLLFVPNALVTYAVQPIPVSLAAAWAVGVIVEMVLVGVGLAYVYRSGK